MGINSWKLRVAQAEFYTIIHLELIYFTVAAKVSSAELGIFYSNLFVNVFSFTAQALSATLLDHVACTNQDNSSKESVLFLNLQ